MRSFRWDIFWLSLLITAGCATTIPPNWPHPELGGQVLGVQMGRIGLTSRYCTQYAPQTYWDRISGKVPVCVTEGFKIYDLKDAGLRAEMAGLNIVCEDVGGSFWTVCADQPGFCHHKVTGHWPFHKDVVSYIDQTEQAKLINMEMVCENRVLFRD